MLRRRVEAWAKDVGAVDPNDPSSKRFEIDDWHIDIMLFGGFREDVVPTGAIAAAMGGGRVVSAETEIREALSAKGKRYGKLDAPVSDRRRGLQGRAGWRRPHRHALIDAALGTVVTQSWVREDDTHEFKEVRLHDGYWDATADPRHHAVGGVLLLPKPHLWDLRDDRWQPLQLRNPHAENPLPDALLPVPGFAVAADGTINETEGTQLADLLGLPAEWPAPA
jgi:hypothetical protein